MIVDNPYVAKLQEAIRTNNHDNIIEFERLNQEFIKETLAELRGKIQKVIRKLSVFDVKKIEKSARRDQRKFYSELIELHRDSKEVADCVKIVKDEARKSLNGDKK